MIIDKETNFVYVSEKLEAKYKDFYLRLTSEFNESRIPYAILQDTADIWAVDYMPIQVSKNKFVQFIKERHWGEALGSKLNNTLYRNSPRVTA
jgi:agmatine deiminase